MKLSISNIAWESEWDDIVYGHMKRLGYEGLEIAPTRIFGDAPYEDLGRVSDWYKDFSKMFVIPSMQSILRGVNDSIFQDDEQRDNLNRYLCKAVDFAAALSCGNLVFGCPRNRNGSEGKRDIAVEFFRKIGDYAASRGTAIGLEPVPKSYNTDFLNTTRETVEFIREVGNAGIKLNLDIGALLTNNEDYSIIFDNVDLVNHVHISEPGLKTVTKHELHSQIRDLLTDSGYEGFISIEMAKQDSPEDIIGVLEYVSELF